MLCEVCQRLLLLVVWGLFLDRILMALCWCMSACIVLSFMIAHVHICIHIEGQSYVHIYIYIYIWHMYKPVRQLLTPLPASSGSCSFCPVRLPCGALVSTTELEAKRRWLAVLGPRNLHFWHRKQKGHGSYIKRLVGAMIKSLRRPMSILNMALLSIILSVAHINIRIVKIVGSGIQRCLVVLGRGSSL